MTLKQRIAVTLPRGNDVADSLALARWAEQEGFDDLWLSDPGSPDALTLAAAVAGVTTRVRVGIAVVPVYTRTPAVLAASIHTLGQLLPERFVIGLGASSQTMMNNWHGLSLDLPVTRVRETAELVRSMLRGEKSAFAGKTLRSNGYKQPALPQPPPIYLAALRPKMIEMAAAVGDGVCFNLWPRKALPKMLEHVRIGAQRAGKDPATVEVVNRHMVLVTGDVAAGRNAFRSKYVPYYANPVYGEFLAWCGYPEAAAAIAAGWARKDRAATMAAMTDDLVDEIAIIGTPERCRQRIAELGAGGVHTHIVAPIEVATPAERDASFAAFARSGTLPPPMLARIG